MKKQSEKLWKKFVRTGLAADYLEYRRSLGTEAAAEAFEDENGNRRSCSESDRYW